MSFTVISVLIDSLYCTLYCTLLHAKRTIQLVITKDSLDRNFDDIYPNTGYLDISPKIAQS